MMRSSRERSRTVKRDFVEKCATVRRANALSLPIGAAQHVAPPRLVAQIPVDRFLDAGLEAFLGLEAELTFGLRGVDGITPVVPESIGHVGDETVDALAACRRALRETAAQTGILREPLFEQSAQ